MDSDTKKIIAGGAVALALAGGAIALAPDDIASNIPPFELTIDEPIANPEYIRSQLELVTAGNLYKDREIKVTLTERTAQENREVFKNYNVTIEKEVKNLTKSDEDKMLNKQKEK